MVMRFFRCGDPDASTRICCALPGRDGREVRRAAADPVAVRRRRRGGAGPAVHPPVLVENAIKHNQDARTALVIAISARRVADRGELEVADNGRGFGLSPVAGPGVDGSLISQHSDG